MTSSTPLELRISGHGPVALALRAMLWTQGWDAPIQVSPAPPEPDPSLRTRAIALSAGSLLLLQQCLRTLPQGADICTVEVQVADETKGLRLLARDLNLERLGRVVFLEELLRATSAPRVQPAEDSKLPLDNSSSRWNASGHLQNTSVALPDTSSPLPDTSRSRPPFWAIEVRADGDPGNDAAIKDSGQSALIAAVRCDHPPPAWALERFRSEGPLALLPDPRPGHLQVVWCAPQSLTVARLERVKTDPEAALRELGIALHCGIAPLAWAGPANTVKLTRRARSRLVEHDDSARTSTVWIGNAAQILHPVAGQGLNLGLRDAAELARTLSDLLALVRFRPEPGVVRSALDKYAALRGSDRSILLGLTDRLASASTWRIFQALAPPCLRALQEFVPARQRVASLFAFGPDALLRPPG
jgi:2-octaprenyl-6-methoxyphenol hydroxylase